MPYTRHPLPSFVDLSKVGELWQERAGLIAEHASTWRAEHAPVPVEDDPLRIACFGIDCQVGFVHPGAALEVPGATDDMVRAVRFLYQHIDRIIHLSFSLDTHFPQQIFHPSFWRDRTGAPPAPFTIITLEAIEAGQWQPAHAPEKAQEYVRQLEANGKYQLMIWPYHCLLGGLSHALVPLVMEAALYHSFVRQTPFHIETKGTHPLTENYSVLEPEVKEIDGEQVGHFREDLFHKLLSYDRIYVWGEASSHCVKATLSSLATRILQTNPQDIGKIYILKDCMSPVPAAPGGPDFPAIAETFLAECEAQGMHLVNSTDPILP